MHSIIKHIKLFYDELLRGKIFQSYSQDRRNYSVANFDKGIRNNYYIKQIKKHQDAIKIDWKIEKKMRENESN